MIAQDRSPLKPMAVLVSGSGDMVELELINLIDHRYAGERGVIAAGAAGVPTRG
jgi:hypothetical protein